MMQPIEILGLLLTGGGLAAIGKVAIDALRARAASLREDRAAAAAIKIKGNAAETAQAGKIAGVAATVVESAGRAIALHDHATDDLKHEIDRLRESLAETRAQAKIDRDDLTRQLAETRAQAADDRTAWRARMADAEARLAAAEDRARLGAAEAGRFRSDVVRLGEMLDRERADRETAADRERGENQGRIRALFSIIETLVGKLQAAGIDAGIDIEAIRRSYSIERPPNEA